KRLPPSPRARAVSEGSALNPPPPAFLAAASPAAASLVPASPFPASTPFHPRSLHAPSLHPRPASVPPASAAPLRLCAAPPAARSAGRAPAGSMAERGLRRPLCGEVKRFCRRVRETYREIQEDLTPYKDDRYYRLAPMRLYTLSKRHFVLVFVVFFVCFGLTVFIGIAGPNVIETSVARTDLNNSLKLKPFNLSSPPLSTYNQQLWLTCVIELDQQDVSLKKNVTMTVKVLGVVKDGSTPYVNNQVHNRTRLLSCAQKCSEIIVAHLGYLNYTQYNIFVSFEDLNKLTDTIQNITFTWKTYNPTFSQVEIWFRFVFVVLTFMVTCLFAHSLRKFSMRDWGIEQKWMSILLPLLLLYNDPFFPLSFLVNSWFPGMLDDLFQSLFLCALLLFWLCVYHGIRVQGERKCLTFYLPKFFIVGLLWLASVTLGIWQTVNEVHDPTYQYRVDTGNFQGMKIFFLVVATTYILYLLFLIVRACSELRNMPYVDLRLKFLTALTFVVLVISIVILYLPEFLSFYGLLNFYLYTLAFVYSPSKNALYESQLKDNPAFSMLNDSDDDVIYGSDYEEMPLQNGQAIRAKYKEESDSD
uniref:Transmembrane protein 181 n=1 Tax=Malurus cyaneus samueli TaxID=2593467 RepID=A0A8C5TE16_9PASS